MSPEERLDRLEALVGLFIAGEQRRRKSLQEQDEKINILIKMQIESEERFNARFAKNEERFERNEERFERTQQAIDRLVGAQARTDEKLQVLIDTLRRTNLGGSFA
jgi:DNA anti-recombination protein RmuC